MIAFYTTWNIPCEFSNLAMTVSFLLFWGQLRKKRKGTLTISLFTASSISDTEAEILIREVKWQYLTRNLSLLTPNLVLFSSRGEIHSMQDLWNTPTVTVCFFEKVEWCSERTHTHTQIYRLKWLQHLGQGQAEVRDWELSHSLPQGWQKPNYCYHHLQLPSVCVSRITEIRSRIRT